MSRHPTVKWAQRSDKIYLTIERPDTTHVYLKLESEGKFIFSAKKGDVTYEVDIELFDRVNHKDSRVVIGATSIRYVIKKDEEKWWSRLLREEGKPPAFLKVDWDKWIDQDDENEEASKDFGDTDFAKSDMGRDDLDMDDTTRIEEEPDKEEEIKEKEPAAADNEEIKT